MLATSVARGVFFRAAEVPQQPHAPAGLLRPGAFPGLCPKAVFAASEGKLKIYLLSAALPLHKSNGFFGHHRSQPPVRVERLVLNVRPRPSTAAGRNGCWEEVGPNVAGRGPMAPCPSENKALPRSFRGASAELPRNSCNDFLEHTLAIGSTTTNLGLHMASAFHSRTHLTVVCSVILYTLIWHDVIMYGAL